MKLGTRLSYAVAVILVATAPVMPATAQQPAPLAPPVQNQSVAPVLLETRALPVKKKMANAQGVAITHAKPAQKTAPALKATAPVRVPRNTAKLLRAPG